MKSTRLMHMMAIALLTIPVVASQENRAEQSRNPVPLINQPLVPDAVAPGGKGFKLTVNGTGFVSDSLVKWNGKALATRFISSSRLTARVPASLIAKRNTSFVTVVNPSPGGGTSNTAFLEVTRSAPVVLSASNYSVGSGPESVAVADFRGTGRLDLALANLYSNTVSVLLGNGDGTFQTPMDYEAGGGPFSVAVGDFNGDGRLDLVVALCCSTVGILLGNGDGSFKAPVEYATGNGPLSVAVGDFNGDGKLDLVTANEGDGKSDGTVSVLLGKGDGTFQTHMDYPAGVAPWSVAVGDFNGDGKLDLAVANSYSNTVSILLGKGNGTFRPQMTYATGPQPISVAVGDVNHDGKLDLAVANFADGTVGVFLGNGDGTFRTHVDYFASSVPSSVVMGDFNGDAKVDLAVANDLSQTVSLLFGNGDGTFRPHLDFGAGPNPQSLAGGDFNRDGKMDLVAANYSFSGNGTASVLLGGGSLTLSPVNMSFGIVIVGQKSSPQNTTLTNVGKTKRHITGITISGEDPADFSETNDCPEYLSVGKFCTIAVTFQPTTYGDRRADVSVSEDGGGGPEAGLSGFGQRKSQCGQRCGPQGQCPTGCRCSFHGCVSQETADLLKESLFDTNAAVTVACGK
jgi:hypothetical protein